MTSGTVCHLTSAHPPRDVRIFYKECVSLAKNGFEVSLIERGESFEENGVKVVGLGEIPGGRLKRMTLGARLVYRRALALDCELYHVHDPELLPYGLKLKRRGKKVIFDSHEDVPAQIMGKTWIPAVLRKAVARAYRSYETHVVRQLDAVVAATPHIAEQFEGRARTVAVINNYPRLDDIVFHAKPFAEREAIVCYAGGISEPRGEKVMAEAMKSVDGVLILAGKHEKAERKEAAGTLRYTGMLDRKGVNELYGRAVAGLCILQPTENYYYSQPIKMYEYMAAGLPFICSDFPGWRKVAEESGAGLCVNWDDIEGISDAVNTLLGDRERAERMGRRGRAYVVENRTWAAEEKKLLLLYGALSAQRSDESR